MIWKTKAASVRGIGNRLATSEIRSFLILLTAGLCCFQSHGVTNGFETPPPQIGSVQWQNLQRAAKERQELYRKRVPVPGAFDTNVPTANGALFAYSQKTAGIQPKSQSADSGMISQIFFWVVVFAFGILIVRKIAPDIWTEITSRLNPWGFEPSVEKGALEKVRAEEEAFAKFLSAFRVGPTSSSQNGPTEKDLVAEFYARAPKLLETQRLLIQDIGRELNNSARQRKLTNLRSEMTSLKGEAGFPETLPVWQMASALEGLLKQLTDKAGNVTPSTLRAVAGGVDLLGNLCVPGLKPDLLTDHPLKFLVVDDELISRQAVSLALKKAFSQPDIAVDGEGAFAQAAQQAYDVIFLDVQLPGMDGFELCTKIRETSLNQNAPIVFVTSHSDFDARARSALSGGNDLMGKPFLTFEITVKALTLALQSRLKNQVRKPLSKSRRHKSDPLMTVAENPFLIPNLTNGTRAPFLTTPETNNFTEAFLSRASTHLGPLRELCRTILQTPDEEARQNILADGFLRINSLVSRNGIEVAHPAYQVSAALEGLLKKMLQKSEHSTPSTLATASAAVDLLNDLCVPGMKADLATNPPVQMLVVDDDLVARRVIVGALQTVFNRPENVENGEAALALASEKPFDVIFLDIQMPGMDGFEVSSKIRKTTLNGDTPIVFVTGHADFQTHTQINRNTNLLQKPFLTSEITVKAMTFALRGRLEQLKKQTVS